MCAADRIRIILQDAEGEPRLSGALVALMVETLCGAAAPGVVTLEGSPGVFCQGMSLEGMAPLLEVSPNTALTEALDRYGDIVAAIRACPRPVMALVDGPALGGGCGIAAAADVVLATRRATFALPEALIGLIPVFAFTSVADRTGISRARLMAMGGPVLDADQALRAGLVDEIADDLEAAALRYASRFARMDQRAIAAIKRIVANTWPSAEGYVPAARLAAIALGATSETRARLSRLVAGELPWIVSAE